MKKTKIIEGSRCPKCGKTENQASYGYNRSGTQRRKCNECKKTYTLDAKNKAYSEEVRNIAIKTYYSGVSGRGVGKVMGFSKANVYNWIKKTKRGVDKSIHELPNI